MFPTTLPPLAADRVTVLRIAAPTPPPDTGHNEDVPCDGCKHWA